VMVIPEEALMYRYVLDERDRPVQVPYGPEGRRMIARTKAEPFFILHVPRSAVWDPAREPRDLNWHEDPKRRREQTAENRRSLESFLNRALAQLDGMVRSGWWILERARVRVTEMCAVPPNE
jgi:hypothetical protein